MWLGIDRLLKSKQRAIPAVVYFSATPTDHMICVALPDNNSDREPNGIRPQEFGPSIIYHWGREGVRHGGR